MAASVREMAGEVIMTGIPGLDLDRETQAALEAMRPSGVILFARNFAGVEQLRRLVERLHGLPSRPRVAIDHEGGRVQRLAQPFTQFPPAREIGRTDDPAVAEAVGRAMGRELRSVGIDIDFAPVLDVDSNPHNPVIGDRAFGSTPGQVSEHGLAFCRGLLAEGVLPCGKHFPGHGDTSRDSHLELPVVRRDRRALDAVELAPFRAAVAAGVPLMMTAHVLYPALDPERPATLSPLILDDLLRAELGFTGVVVSDDLEMRAVSDRMPVAEAALASLRAGVDWVLICNDLEQSVRAAERIAAALSNGELAADRVASAARRIRALAAPPPAGRPLALPAGEHAALAARVAALAAGRREA